VTAGHIKNMPRNDDQSSSNFSSPNFSRLQASLSPALSQTCFSLGYPAMTPSGVPVNMISPGFIVMILETKAINCRQLKIRSFSAVYDPSGCQERFRLTGDTAVRYA